MKTILILCTGNLCRSPMAEGLLKHKLRQTGQADRFAVTSAGVWTSDGRPATGYAVQVIAERGLDISAHRSRNVTGDMVAQASLILTMTRSQAEAVRLEFPAHAHKVHLLSEACNQRHDVEDPLGGTLLDYRATAKEIERLIEEGYDKILEWAEREA